jgi:hypothetical protein
VGTPGATCGWTACSPDVHPASAAPAIPAPAICKNRRRDMPYMFIAKCVLLKRRYLPVMLEP